MRLETGRKRQIRVRFRGIFSELSGTGRHALHAWSLELKRPVSGKPLRFRDSLSPELAALLGG